MTLRSACRATGSTSLTAVSDHGASSWRRRPDLRRATSGGGHQYYTGVDRDQNADAAMPEIANGMDVQAIAEVLIEQLQSRIAAHGLRAGTTFDIDKDEVNPLLAKLPSQPDEKLR